MFKSNKNIFKYRTFTSKATNINGKDETVENALENAFKPERQNKGTFAFQNSLPKLPVPNLKNSLNLYLEVMRPHLSITSLNKLKNDLDCFMQNQGPSLQTRLLNYSKKKDNWLEEIWLNKAYLEPRYPILLNVNWHIQFTNNPFGLVEAPHKNKTTSFQIMRASILVHSLLTKNNEIIKQTLPPTVDRNGNKFCMDQFKRVFGVSRIPELNKDKLKITWPSNQKHIILLYKDQFVKVQVYDDNHNLLSHTDIYILLSKAVNDIESLPHDKMQPNIGIMTSENRDTWAKTRNKLLLNQINKSNIEDIDTSLLVLCLDDSSPENNLDVSHHVFFHNRNARNRWFDKSIQLIVCNNGLAGVNGEHTPTDAVVPGKIFHEALTKEKDYLIDKNIVLMNNFKPDSYIKHLKWRVDKSTLKTLQNAVTKAENFTSHINSIFLTFENYGSERIKALNISPDAYVQLALQLTYYRMYSKCCHTYETASLRGFLKGRTETGRPCTIESLKFCEIFDNKNVLKENKIKLFQLATRAHLNYMKLASSGRGFDRHFLGLKSMSDNNSLSFLESEDLQKSFSFVLSTSNMTPGTYISGGFAPVTENGYGINYAIDSNRIRFSISTWNHPETSGTEFRRTLYNSLIDLKSFED